MEVERERSAVPGLVLGFVVVLAAIFIILGSNPGTPPVVRGAPAPGFSLPRLTAGEGPSSLSLSDLSGRVVLLNFWATWCEPCESEMPAMERLYGALPRERFELVAISIDDVREDVERFQERYQLSFPIILDADQSVYEAYQTMGVPESLLLDERGRIVERYVGPREWDAKEYVERIRELIEASDSLDVGEVPGGVPIRPEL